MTDFVQISREPRIRDVDFFPMANEMYERIWERLMPPQLLTEELSGKVARNVVTPKDAPVPDCMTCGACCALMPCVGVPPAADLDPQLLWDITKESEGSEIVVDRFVRRDGDTMACLALEVTETRVSCSIYESRPQMCRDFEAGSDRCHALRRAVGLEPFLTLEEMSEAVRRLEGRSADLEPANVIRNADIKRETDTGRHTITVLMHDGSMKPIHSYDPDAETYFQFEFDGLSLDSAQALITSRTV